MYPLKIQLSGLIPGIFLLWVISATPFRSVAQSCGGTIQTVTYTTSVSGTGSDVYSPTLPQYNPSGYTLLSATVDAYLTTTSTVSFLNTNASSGATFNPSIGRSDEIDFNGSYLSSGSGNYNLPHTVLTKSGTAGDSKSYGPLTIFNNYNIIDYTIDNSDPTLTDFEGMGNLNLSYSSTTFINNVTLGVTSGATVADNITLSVTYTFCNPVVLSSNIVTFTAIRQDPQTVALSWITANEQAGRKYVVEVSHNGSNFITSSSRYSDPVQGESSYSDSYVIAPGSSGKLWFRLKQVEVDGTVSYSPLRIIDLDDSGISREFSIYPNPPTDFINVQFPPGSPGWQVDILAADGSLVQRNAFYGLVAGRVNFIHRLAAGTYFVRATDLPGTRRYAAAFVIR